MNKNVFITGGSRGLGKHLVMYLASLGYDIILNYVKEDNKALEVKKEVEEKYLRNVWLMKGDISKEEDIKRMFLEFKKLNISLDVLILNAGIDNVCDIKEKNYQSMEKILKVNLLGNYMMTKVFGEYMDNMGHGVIIYINSDNVLGNNDPVTLEYDVSKAGLLMLALDYSMYFKNVKVHSIAPGFLDTDMNKEFELEHDLIDFVEFEDVCLEVKKQIEEDKSGNVVRVYARNVRY